MEFLYLADTDANLFLDGCHKFKVLPWFNQCLTPGYQPAGFPRKDLGQGRQKVAEISMPVEMLSPVVCLIFKIITVL